MIAPISQRVAHIRFVTGKFALVQSELVEAESGKIHTTFSVPLNQRPPPPHKRSKTRASGSEREFGPRERCESSKSARRAGNSCVHERHTGPKLFCPRGCRKTGEAATDYDKVVDITHRTIRFVYLSLNWLQR